MKNKGFSLVELVIVIVVIAIIMLIGTVAYTGIQERAKVRADKQTAGEIGRALVIRETDIGKEKPIPYYPVLTIYDELVEVENYVAKGIKPQSMDDGYFIATAIQTKNGKKIIVGIGKIGDEITDKPYQNGKEPGWAWSEDVEINDFLEENQEKLTETPIISGNGGGNGGTPLPPLEGPGHVLTVGINNMVKLQTKKEEGENTEITSGGNYTAWQIMGIENREDNLNFNMPGNDVKIIGITGE